MKLLIDTDAFCKLGIAGLLEDAVAQLGLRLADCGRLAALPYMLRRGRLLRRYGVDTCRSLTASAMTIPVCPQPRAEFIDPFTQNEAIDPGEAELFAAAIEFDLLVLSGDKRAIRSLKNTTAVHQMLAQRILVIDAILLELCDRLGPAELRRRVAPLVAHDQLVAICFGAANSDPHAGLLSYYEDLVAEVQPLLLCDPRTRRIT